MVSKFLRKIKILHTALVYCIGLRSTNITHNSVLNRIFGTVRTTYCVLSINTQKNGFFMVVRAGTGHEENGSSD